MVTFPNPAGGSMNVANEAEARSRGWTPAMGSFGVNSYPTGGGGGGGGTTSVQPQVGSNQRDVLNAFAAGSGFSIKQLEENKRQFDLQMAAAKDQMERIGIPQLEIQKRLAEAQIAFQDQQMALARQNQALSEEIQRGQLGLQTAGVTGTYNGQPTEQAREFNQGQALQYLTQASQFAASDPFALSDFTRGAALQPGLPVFLQNLQNNVAGAAAGNVGPEARAATTLPMLSRSLQGQGQVNPQTDTALNAIGGIYQRGANQLGTGTLEGLDSNELNTLQQGITRLYGAQAAPAFLAAYQRSRPMQTAARTSYQAA